MERLRRKINQWLGKEYYLEFELTHTVDGIFGWIFIYRYGLLFGDIGISTDDVEIYELKHLFNKKYVTESKLNRIEDHINIRFNEL